MKVEDTTKGETSNHHAQQCPMYSMYSATRSEIIFMGTMRLEEIFGKNKVECLSTLRVRV